MSLTPCTLSDDDLIEAIASIAGVERTATASLITHLAELESRNLHLAWGFRSLFGYCRVMLHCSEHEAYNRMEVVHAARRFPVILPLLAEGLLHLTAVRLLAPHLNDEDHLALLGGAIHKSRREVLKHLARWFPSEDAPSSMRKLPVHGSTVSGDRHPVAVPGVSAGAPPAATVTAPLTTSPQPSEGSRPAVAPLSADRYRLPVTIDSDAHDDLRRLQDMMRREIPDGDAAAIVARALKLLRHEVERKAFSATHRPRPARVATRGTRHIPASVQRAVWERDDGQCAFGGQGRRCAERSFLEFHHVTPWAVGGLPSRENIALRCRAHNAYEAAVYFGPVRAAMSVDRASGPLPDGFARPGSTGPAP